MHDRLKVLVLSEVEPKRYSTLLEALSKDCDFDLRLYGEGGLAAVLRDIDVGNYDRTLFASGVRRAGSQFLAMRGLPEVHVFDLDLQQDYMADSKYYRLFPPLFKTLEKVRLVVTSLASYHHYRGLGFAVSYLPKAYDHRLIEFEGRPRDIDYGFVGRVGNEIYKSRRRLLDDIRRQVPVQLLRTEDASEKSNEYNDLLNRIRFFVSADAGFEEYHIKNFEAMAAGCVVCALRTSEEEADLLGFRDMQNIILYKDASELKEKLDMVEKNSGVWERISDEGRRLAQERHQWRHRKFELQEALNADGSSPPPKTFSDRARFAYLRSYLALSGR